MLRRVPASCGVVTRRAVQGAIRVVVVATVAAALTGCGAGTTRSDEREEATREVTTLSTGEAARSGRLLSRPGTPTRPGATGSRPLGVDPERDAVLHVPAGYRPERPAPLVVVLHGAGGTAQSGIDLLRRLADERGLILLAPQSQGSTWDAIMGGYGPDVGQIDRALARVFEEYAVDAERISIGGFSDGASYALAVGLGNGDLFRHVIAFAPGYIPAGAGRTESPRLFISHGTQDRVLPIERCSRRIVPELKRAGYDVLYREFDGPHTVPPTIADEAIDWLLTA